MSLNCVVLYLEGVLKFVYHVHVYNICTFTQSCGVLYIGAGVDVKNLDAIQAKLQQANEEKATSLEVTTLQQEESVSISGSNARLMIMKKLSRKSEVCAQCLYVC